MEKTMQHSANTHDELTTEAFNRQIKEVFLFLKYLCCRYFRAMKRLYRMMTFLLFITIFITAYTIFHPIKKYEGQASFAYNDLTKKLYGEMIDKVEALIQTRSYEQLREIIQLPLNQIQHISKIKATNIYGSPLSDDMTNNNANVFYISVAASHIKAFDNLGKAMENYLNNNIAVREVLHRRIDEFTQGIVYRRKELQMFDSLTKAYAQSLEKPASAMFSTNANQFNPAQLFEKGERITQEIVDMQSFLDDCRAVKLQEPFLVSMTAQSMSVWKIILISLAGFASISTLLIFVSILFTSKYVAQ